MAPKAQPRVLFFSYHLPRDEEPGAFRPWMEARLLQASGFEVTVITSGVHYMTGRDSRPGRGWCTEEWADGIRILKTWGPINFRRSTLGRLWHYLAYSCLAGLAALVRVGRIDRVFAGTDPITIMPVVFLVSRLKQAPMVLDERDLYPETAVALGVMQKGYLSRFIFNLQQFFRRQALGLLAATPGIRTKLLEYGHSPQKIKLLYNADVFLDDQSRKVVKTDSLKEKTGKEFLVGYAGGLGRANDIMTLLQAAKQLRDLSKLGIVIIGAGEELPRYQEYCRQQGLSNVFFLGPQPRNRTRALLMEIDIGVQLLPPQQHFAHTLTSKTFDYHGLGKPLIFGGRGDTVRLLAASGGGLAIPPGDPKALAGAIIRLIQDEAQLRAMALAARNWYECHISLPAAIDIMQKVMGYGAA